MLRRPQTRFFSSPGLQAGVSGSRRYLQAVSTAISALASALAMTRAKAGEGKPAQAGSKIS